MKPITLYARARNATELPACRCCYSFGCTATALYSASGIG